MAEEHTERNKAPDEVRELQPFAFTSGGPGDFRPLASTYDEDKVEENTATPKDESVPEPAGSQVVPPTESASGEDVSEDNPVSQTTPEPDSQSDKSNEKAPVKPAPSLAAKAKSTKENESS